MSNPGNYTVGWVCALTCEYVAAQEFLDEEHDPPESLQPNDTNDYTLGRISKHNIVIAVLPDGEYGTAMAATVATNMLNSFPNVRIGLMVGIGGGAPSPTNDIRLGDVVVSAPREANGAPNGGVFEYDFGKTIQDQAFQVTRFLNQPPPTLRAAVRGLEALYTRKGHQLGKAVSDVISKNPMLQDKYSRPNSSMDVLFRSELAHDSRGCAEFCAKEPSSQVPRPQRTIYHEKPYIHHGIIASANQLMKDATIRDRLARERNVLCFEMEAAGLMNIFPCLVIRGICDYSDSHKNKDWQGYAAMVAAAYAKDLLNRIVPSRIDNEQRMSDMLSTTLHAVENTGETVDAIKSRSDRERELEMLNWLTAIDYGPQQSDILKRHQPGTGRWMLESWRFQTWITTKGGALFCPGIPGAGKTIMTSVVINHLMEKLREEPNSGLAYLYCDFKRRDEQTVEHFVSSLLKQLAERHPSLPDPVQQLHERHVKLRTRPSLEELLESLQCVIGLFSRVFILIDALDECQEFNNCLPRLLSMLIDLRQRRGANIFATARPLGHITSRFGKAISMEIRANGEDVRMYIKGRLGELPRIVQTNPELQNAIMNCISEAVDGMFLLAKLHFESLIGKMTAKSIQTTLKSLPTGSSAYDSAYEEAMNRIEDQNRDKRDMAKRTLLWIVCAKRRLAKPELQEALAVEIGETKLDQDNLPNMEDVASVCAGLVAIDRNSDVVRLVHYTAQDFFERTRDKWFQGAESHISEVCLTYLLLEQFPEGVKHVQRSNQILFQSDEDLFGLGLSNESKDEWGLRSPFHRFTSRKNEERGLEGEREDKGRGIIQKKVPQSISTLWEDRYLFRKPKDPFEEWGFRVNDPQRPFHQYAARNWGIHVGNASLQEHHRVIAFLESDGPLQESMRHFKGLGSSTPTTTGLFLTVYFGLDQTIGVLLQRGHDPNVPFGSQHDNDELTPLIYAVQHGQSKVVKALLLGQANPNWADREKWTALWHAASAGYHDILKLLIDNGANPDHQVPEGQTVLGIACQRGDYEIIKVLLTGQANPNLANIQKRTALWYAASEGYDHIAKLLIDKGANPNHQDLHGATVLGVACEHGHTSVVEALLPSAQIDLNSRHLGSDFHGVFLQPLFIAVASGHARVLETLIKNGATTGLGEDWAKEALYLALKYGHDEVVRVLLRGCSNWHSVALFTAAARRDRPDLFDTSLTAGAKADEQGNWKYMI